VGLSLVLAVCVASFSTPVTLHTYPPMKMEQTQCYETLAFKLQMLGNRPEESIRYSEHGKGLKSRTFYVLCTMHCNIIMQYKPTKCTFSKLIF
jgi:hypothetical protein